MVVFILCSKYDILVHFERKLHCINKIPQCIDINNIIKKTEALSCIFNVCV